MSSDKIQVVVDADLEELIPGFLENRSKDVGNLRSALAGDDFETLRSVGHSLKGVGGGYGFDLISEIGAKIETAAKAGDKDSIPGLIDEFADYLERVEITFE